MAGIKDVAKRAGVGVGTVSRAVNKTGYVSKETRDKIMQAIEELDYIPNELARNLSKRHTGIIGVIIPDLENPFYGKLIKYIEMELYNRGYKTMVCNTISISNREKEYVDMLERNIMDGIITGALSLDEATYLRINKPIVSMDHDFGPTIPLIHSNHKKGGQLLAEHLINKGCRNAVMIGGYFDTKTPSNDRYSEFERLMTEAGGSVQTLNTVWNKMDYSYYRQLMDNHKELFQWADCVYTSDLGAISIYRAAVESGYSIPKDLKIVGYDGMDITRMSSPVITAVCQDVVELAKLYVDTMIGLIEGNKEISNHQVVDVSLQLGGTT